MPRSRATTWPRRRATTAVLLFLLALAAPPALAATISGFVRGADNGEALSYATVTIAGSPRGAMTNQKGYYVITGLSAGAYTVTLSYIGYLPATRAVTLASDQELTLTVDLAPGKLLLETVEVTAKASELQETPGTLTMRTPQLTAMPAAVEADLFRAVQALPGVSTLSDFSAGLYVRGGSPDQNLILLDDIDVYNPSHLFGFFSTFNVDAVKTVELQKAGFPARYGGRLSSLLDVHDREGNRKHLAGTIRSSIIASSATLEGPWRKGSWMVSGRHTYIGPLARAAKIDLPYKFYDVHGRVNYDVSDNDHTSLSYYTGRDDLAWDRPGLNLSLDWGNATWSGQWTHIFTRRLFSHFVLGHSKFDSRATFAFQDFAFRTKNEINDLSLKAGLAWTPSASHVVDLGTELKSLDFSFRREAGEDRLNFHYQGMYGALYLQDAWNVSEEWKVQAGLRADYYDKGSYLRVGPRLSVQRKLNEMTTVRATYGRYSQFLNLVAQEGASFADMWFPVDRTLRPGGADHYILGVSYGPFETFELSVEGYYKPYRNLVEFSEEFTRSLVSQNATVGELFNSGTGKAYGAEAYLRNHWKGWEGWLGYSYGVTTRTIRGYNFGRTFHPTYDRRHQVVLMQERGLGKHWKMSATFHYGSGQPMTLATGRYTVRDISGREYDVVLDGEKNASRLPDYHRLDVAFTYHKQFRSWSLEPEIQVVNVYNRRNVYVRSYDMTKNPATFQDVTMLPFLPTIGLTARF
jgi:outer membrane receptor protein involved in Fe transport